ncbi:MAG: class I adenylate-forming enzyme family protein [Planctomycetota bacterium]|jgi:amino acid adenylation domain-containing protein
MFLTREFLERSADATPDKVALVHGSDRLTYAQVEAQANRLANALREGGIRRGDRVVLHLPNSVELAVGIFGVLKADAVFVVANITMKPEKLGRVVADSGAAAVLLPSRRADVGRGLLGRVPALRTVLLVGEGSGDASASRTGLSSYEDLQREASTRRPASRGIDQDLACLIYTSGSSGVPKGVMSSHANVAFAASSIIEYLQNRPDDVVICALPLSFDYGLYQLLMTFKFGGTLVLERTFAYPAQFMKRVESERVTGLPGIPTMFSILLNMDLGAYDLEALRYVTNTAAALPLTQVQQLRERFPRARLFSMYGLTETKRTLYLPPSEIDRRPGSVGIAIPGTEVWLVDEEDRRLGPNEVGELVIRGGHVMRGYWGKPEATAARFRPGPMAGERVCYSGDLMRMDEEGYFYFVGRKDDIIKSRGEKVSPTEVENVLCDLPGVKEAAVIGVPDPVLGEAIKALVVVADTALLSEKDMLKHCRAHLEDYMVPQRIEFVDALPKTSSGKIRRASLTQ